MASMQTGGAGLEVPISAWGGIWHQSPAGDQSAGDDQLYCASLVFPEFYFSVSPFNITSSSGSNLTLFQFFNNS